MYRIMYAQPSAKMWSVLDGILDQDGSGELFAWRSSDKKLCAVLFAKTIDDSSPLLIAFRSSNAASSCRSSSSISQKRISPYFHPLTESPPEFLPFWRISPALIETFVVNEL